MLPEIGGSARAALRGREAFSRAFMTPRKRVIDSCRA